jgi:alpha-1,3/alpha-1,6-mannosyltransferase
MNNNNSKRVLFVHPDLGIGGAERLVVDAALALLECGHQVEFFTSHCDPAHAFEEVKTGKVKVTVCGDWIPTHVFGRLHVMFAMLRMIWVSLWLLFSGERADVVFCDQVSVCVPFLRWVGRRVIFYIHFPDKLLAKPEGRLKALYRAPFDYLEERTTNSADVLVCNSKFTASIVKKHFPSISRSPLVLYPTTMLTAPNGAKRGHEVDAIVGKVKIFTLSCFCLPFRRNASSCR